MITIEKIDSDLTEQCTSCLCSTQEKEIFMMHIFKDPRQRVGIKICKDCLQQLKDSIDNIQ